MNVSRNRHFRRRLVAAPARLAHLERGWRVMIEAGSQRAQRLFSLHFARFPAWLPAPARSCGQRRRRSRRPPQRRQQESPPSPIEAMLRRSEMTKTERCAGGNILAMRCRFASTHNARVKESRPSEGFVRLWTRHGCYTVEPDGSIHVSGLSGPARTIILERTKITGLMKTL